MTVAPVRSAAEVAPVGMRTLCRCIHSALPTMTGLPLMDALAPLPGSCVKEPSSTLAGAKPFMRLYAVIATASGCVVLLSTPARNDITCGCGNSGANITLVTTGRPDVSVPVLSNTTVSTPEAVSRTSPPRMSSPLRAAAEVPTRTAVGVARPSAQGHATTSTLQASCRLSSSLAPSEPAAAPAALAAPPAAPASLDERTCGKTCVPAVAQKMSVAADAPITP
mmetsp:Transcript_11513/g.29487  ORF Transcript_11513/g.29487 Transcript_11513/m.29487 type:complete len:223 (-) Transcript_11513:620-1288(-)